MWNVKNSLADDDLLTRRSSETLKTLKKKLSLKSLPAIRSSPCSLCASKKIPVHTNSAMMTFQKPGDRPLYLTGIGFILAIRLNRRLVWFIFCLPTEHFLAFRRPFFLCYCSVVLCPSCWLCVNVFLDFVERIVVNTTDNIIKNKNKMAFTFHNNPLTLGCISF